MPNMVPHAPADPRKGGWEHAECLDCPVRRFQTGADGQGQAMNLWTIFLVLGIVAFILIIIGRRRV